MLEGADETQQEFLSCVIDSIDAVIGFSDRYRQAALEAGNLVAADILTRVPRQGAKTFRGGTAIFPHHCILRFGAKGEYHNTTGALIKICGHI